MKKKLILIIFILFLSIFVIGKTIHSFDELLTPERMKIRGNRIFITEEFRVHIYSLIDFSLIKTIGKKGEGPGEFVGRLYIYPLDDLLYVNSMRKLSVFDKTGNLLRELRSKDSFANRFKPFNGKFIGQSYEIDKERNRFRLINIYNNDLSREKIVIREPHMNSFEKGITIFDTTFQVKVLRDKIYVVNGKEFKIDIYDGTFKKNLVIKKDYNRVKFGKKDKQKAIDNLRSNPQLKSFADEILKKQKYPDYYPAIHGLYDNGEYLFVMTYRWKGDNIEFFVFDLSGDFKKQIFIPFKMKSIYNAFPWDLKENKFYQLIENEDEEWELVETELNLK
ncbi:MAG: hypothetical protein ABFR75_10190 [Acidobacteriota bacterium]